MPNTDTGRGFQNRKVYLLKRIWEELRNKLSGYVVGPASSTDNAVARYDGTTGKIIQNTGVIISDADVISGASKVEAGIVGVTDSDASHYMYLDCGTNLTTNRTIMIYPGDSDRSLTFNSNFVFTDVTAYTIEAANISNLDSPPVISGYYQRVGTLVHLWGTFDANVTLASTTTRFEIPLPITSNFENDYDAIGSAHTPTERATSLTCFAETTNNEIVVEWISGTNTNSQTFYFVIEYVII